MALAHRDDTEKESGEMGLRFVFCFKHGQGPVMAHCFSVSIEISIVQLGMYIYVVILFHETVILLIKMKKMHSKFCHVLNYALFVWDTKGNKRSAEFKVKF